jgi:hypothetical protein
MKKNILILIISLTTTISFSQSELQESINSDSNTLAVTYRLYPTKNIWNFIKLNTRTGQMWQVQFDVEGSNRFETNLNYYPLVQKEKELDNRFKLYPTQNNWNFILLDQIDGKTWQVQWSIEAENRVVIPID